VFYISLDASPRICARSDTYIISESVPHGLSTTPDPFRPGVFFLPAAVHVRTG